MQEALGETTPLSYEMFQRAVVERLGEDERLDWKGRLPDDGDEVAKDVAALANSRGGLLVYGVVEDRATGRADRIEPVNLTDAVQRRIRSWLQRRVHPGVSGVELLDLPCSDGEAEGLLVLDVPQSPDAPHLIGGAEKLGAPYRVGTQAFWMDERGLERAYRDRLSRRESDEARLSQMIDYLSEQLELERDAWILGVATPSVAAPLTAQRRGRTEATEVLAAADAVSRRLFGRQDDRSFFIEAMGDAARNPRVGLRRWVAHTRPAGTGPETRSDFVHAEIHHDGSASLAVRIEGWHGGAIDGKHCMLWWVLNGFIADFVALTRVLTDRTGANGPSLLRIELLRGDERPHAMIVRGSTGPAYPNSRLRLATYAGSYRFTACSMPRTPTTTRRSSWQPTLRVSSAYRKLNSDGDNTYVLGIASLPHSRRA